MARYVILSLVALLGFTAAAGGAEAPRWNILFCFADDWGRYASCYAPVDGRPSLNEVVKTPNVDRVAREGVLFRNAFVNAPSCTPCRSSLVSGRYFFNCGRGAILQGAIWDPAIPSFPLLLRDAGYHIGKSYKVWSPGTPADAPFGGQQYAYEAAGRLPNNFSEEATKLVNAGDTVAAAREKILAQVRGNFDAFLADRKPGQPWLYWFGSTTTHRVWIKGSGKKLWGIEPDSLRGQAAQIPARCAGNPRGRGRLPGRMPGVRCGGRRAAGQAGRGGRARPDARRRSAATTACRACTSGKCNLYDHGVAVTLAMRVPGGKGGRVVDDFVRLPDLAPTFMEVGGVKPPAGLYGTVAAAGA